MSAARHLFSFLDDSGDIPRQVAVPAYTPPKNSTTTATTGPQVRSGQPGQGDFKVLGVRPRGGPSLAIGPVPTGPRVPPVKIPPGDKAGAGPGVDSTRGLLTNRGTGRTLLS